MELASARDISAEKWVLTTGKALFCLAALLTAALWMVLIFGKYSTFEKCSPALPMPLASSLGQGPLALMRPQRAEFQPLLHELVLVGASTRPDQDHERFCSLALRSSGEERTLSVGETVYFEMKEGRPFFSREGSDLSLTVRSLESGLMICDIKCKNLSESCLLSSSAIFSQPLDHEPYVEVLKKGSVWGKDVFLTGWGGDEYREMTNKVKVSLGADVYFVKTGDFLWWNGRTWTHEFRDHEIQDAAMPIAQVVKTNSHGADIQVWDATGFSSQVIHLGLQTSPKSSVNISELMTAIRPRSATEITCQLGKRRVIVREGDWWIRYNDRWRPVRTAADLEACLYHQIPGELFIFEKVEASKGSVVLEARAFDRMRTFSEPVSLVLQTEKKPSIAERPSRGSPHLAKNRSHRTLMTHSAKEDEGL
ncbi:MAG: hypothetical protein ABSA17_00545 [Rhabdochlamydiaceae bacterium]|jgi:hypothetical protein